VRRPAEIEALGLDLLEIRRHVPKIKITGIK